MKIAIPTIGKRKLSNRVADTFSRAPTFTIVTLKNHEIVDVETIENPASAIEQGAGPIAVRTIKEHGVDVLISEEMGPGARTILDAFEINIHKASVGKKVNEIVEEWQKL